jgi:mannose-6-phosphate isomerase-like protein (cupin superfamily)
VEANHDEELTIHVSAGITHRWRRVCAGRSFTTLMSKDLPEYPGKEGMMITVVYPPGASDPIHRHNAHAFVYVLEGTVVMQVKGGKELTLTPGQTFYEGPNDIHTRPQRKRHETGQVPRGFCE